MTRLIVGAALTVALTIASVAVFSGPSESSGGVRSDPDLVFVSNGCNGCHSLNEVRANVEVGPDLSDIESHADDRVPGLSAEEYIRQSVTDPQAYIVPGFGPHMPTLPLTPEEVSVLIDLLLQPDGE